MITGGVSWCCRGIFAAVYMGWVMPIVQVVSEFPLTFQMWRQDCEGRAICMGWVMSSQQSCIVGQLGCVSSACRPVPAHIEVAWGSWPGQGLLQNIHELRVLEGTLTLFGVIISPWFCPHPSPPHPNHAGMWPQPTALPPSQRAEAAGVR